MTDYLPEPTTAEEVLARVKARRRAIVSAPKQFLESAPPIKKRDLVTESLRYERAKREEQEKLERETVENMRRRVLAKVAAPLRAIDIITEVSDETGVPVHFIMSYRRVQKIVEARFEAIKRVYEETNWSLNRLGKLFNRDHTSILNALRRVGAVDNGIRGRLPRLGGKSR